MDYSKYTREQLIERLVELEMLNKELLAEKQQETKLDFAWTGNLGHWYWNIKTNSVVFNPLKVTALGYTMEELPNKVSYQFFTDKLHSEDYEKTMDAMRKHMRGEASVYEAEYRIQAKDKSWKWFYDRGKITQRDSSGNPIFVSGIVFDISNRKENELKLEQMNKDLKQQSSTDVLTGIKNRKAIMDALEILANKAIVYNTDLSIAMFDIDNFKNLNDTEGHVFGDEVLKKVAEILSETIREFDMVGRYGGEEFLVIFPNTKKKNAYSVAQRIRKNVERYVFEKNIKVTISGGVEQYQKERIESFIDAADKKLYIAKKLGRNRVEI